MNSPQPLDIVTVMVVVSGLLFSPRIAAIVGPYAVILAGAVLGGAVSAASRPKDERIGTIGYLLMVVTFALLVTVPLSEVTAPHVRLSEPRLLFGPVAAVISGIGYRWPKFIGIALEFARSLLTRRYGGGAPPNEPPPGGQP
jgi:hypothetical protein